MKKLLCMLFLLLALVCVLAACDKTETPSTNNGDTNIEQNGGGSSQGNNNQGGDNNTPTHTHTYGEWSVSKAATCGAKGEEKRTCACGESETREIVATGEHTYGTDNKCTGCQLQLVYTEGLEYILNSDAESYTVKKGTALTNTTEIVIPSYYNGKPVTSIGEKAFYECTSLTSIEIPASVTSIGHLAFYCCTSLTGVYITDIAAWCNIGFGDSYANPLSYAKNLYLNNALVTDLVIPSTVTSIGDCAFHKCTSLMSVTFGEGSQLTSIGYDAFYNCTSLTSIEIPASVTSIGERAFFECMNLRSVTIDDIENGQLRSIGERAFNNCWSLMSIEIPASVTSIGYDAFYHCYKLIEVYNLSSLNIIEYSDCGYVGYYTKNIYTSTTGESKLFTDDNGYIFYDDGTNRYLMGYTGDSAVLTLPASCNGKNYSIYQCAFYNCKNLVRITIPSNVINVDDRAFYNCTSLTSIEIPTSVTSIGNYAFYRCTSLTSIEIPASVTSIGNYAFAYCTSLTAIEIPASVTSIGYGAFCGCTSLTSVTFTQTSGWVVTDHSNGNKVAISATDLADPATAAEYLTSTYDFYYWNRTEE